jgi:hypothetical protein
MLYSAVGYATLPAGRRIDDRRHREQGVKKFVFLSYGFETPTPEVMNAWGKWFASIKDRIVDMSMFKGGREITRAGTIDLPDGRESITGFVIVNAENLDDAMGMAKSNPFITGIRVYETMTK